MNQQEQDAMDLANELAAIQVVMASEAGTWNNLTEQQRSTVRVLKRKGQEYIEKYGAGIKNPAEAG